MIKIPNVCFSELYHEAGHAVVGWFLEFADPLLKVFSGFLFWHNYELIALGISPVKVSV